MASASFHLIEIANVLASRDRRVELIKIAVDQRQQIRRYG
jgi:hypothetical protein